MTMLGNLANAVLGRNSVAASSATSSPRRGKTQAIAIAASSTPLLISRLSDSLQLAAIIMCVVVLMYIATMIYLLVRRIVSIKTQGTEIQFAHPMDFRSAIKPEPKSESTATAKDVAPAVAKDAATTVAKDAAMAGTPHQS